MVKPKADLRVTLIIGNAKTTAAQLQHWRRAWKLLSEMPAPCPAAKAEAETETKGSGKAQS